MYFRTLFAFAVSLPVLAQSTSAVIQPGTTSTAAQPGPATSFVRPGTTSTTAQPGNSSSFVQPGTTSETTQPGTTEIIQPGTTETTQPGATPEIIQPGTTASSVPLGARRAVIPQPWNNYTFDERFHDYVKSIVGPSAIGKTLFGATLKQLRGDIPPEWGTGAEGFGKALAFKYLDRLSSHTIEFGVGALIGEDPRYFPSTNKAFWARVGHAVKASFFGHVEGGGERFAFARFAGAYGSAALSNLWLPSGSGGLGHTFGKGTKSIGEDIGSNLFKEFWPDIKHKFLKR